MSADFNAAKQAFIQQISAEDFQFATTLAFVDTHFDFVATGFDNGSVRNEADQNQGSAKVLALSEQLGLDKTQTLQCFGEHYRDVLATPDVENHHNLRRLLKEGVTEVRFDQFPLSLKAGA